MVIVTNLARWIARDTSLYLSGEGLNYVIALFVAGAGFIGWFSSNKDRSILAWFVFFIGVCSSVFVHWGYDQNIVMLISFSILVIVSSLIIGNIKVQHL